MATASAAILCQQCAKKDKSEADWFCMDCQINLCHQCLQSHKLIPLLQNHSFRSCTAQVAAESDVKLKGKQLVELFEENVQKKMDNQSKDKQYDSSTLQNPSKILASRSTLERMIQGLSIEEKCISVRHIKGHLGQIMSGIKHLKTVDNLIGEPYRLSIVNNKIWIRYGDVDIPNLSIAVYDTDLAKINEVKYKDDKTISTCHQVSDTEVIVATGNALYVFHVQGTFLYKILNGLFGDISTYGDTVSVIDCKDNKVIKLTKREHKWQKCEEFTVNDSDTKLKTIHSMHNCVYICFNFGEKICKYSSEGELLCTFGTGNEGNQLGEFDNPLVCGSDDSGDLIVADVINNRFQILDQHNRWTDITLEGIERPRDIIVMDSYVYILHGPNTARKLSKYRI